MVHIGSAETFRSAVFSVLRQQRGVVSEYVLIQLLQQQGDLNGVLGEGASTEALYRGHFLLMNALYSLQSDLVGSGIYLTVSALEIGFLPAAERGETALSADGSELAAYYLDWDNFDLSGAEIEQLLSVFWQNFLSPEKQQDALQCLGLTSGATKTDIVAAYRSLAREHHPDRGGDPAMFLRVREAYELLREH